MENTFGQQLAAVYQRVVQKAWTAEQAQEELQRMALDLEQWSESIDDIAVPDSHAYPPEDVKALTWEGVHRYQDALEILSDALTRHDTESAQSALVLAEGGDGLLQELLIQMRPTARHVREE